MTTITPQMIQPAVAAIMTAATQLQVIAAGALPASPAGTEVDAPGTGTIIDLGGATWSFGGATGNQFMTLRNGANVGGALKMVMDINQEFWVQNAVPVWYHWNLHTVTWDTPVTTAPTL